MIHLGVSRMTAAMTNVQSVVAGQADCGSELLDKTL